MALQTVRSPFHAAIATLAHRIEIGSDPSCAKIGKVVGGGAYASPQRLVEEATLKICMKAGDRVRVKESVLVYHHPEHRNEPFELQGQEGEIVDIVSVWHDRPISANFPVLVKFTKKFKAHLRDVELEII